MEERKRVIDELLSSEKNPAKRQRLQQEAEIELGAEPDQIPEVVLSFLQSVNTVRLPFVQIWRLVQAFPALLASSVGQQWDDAWFQERVRYEFPDAYAAAVQPGTDIMRSSHADKLRTMAVRSTARPFNLLSDERRGQPWFLEYQRLRRVGQLFKAHDKQTTVYQPHNPIRTSEGFKIASVSANSCWAAYQVHSPLSDWRFSSEYWLHRWTESAPPVPWINPYRNLIDQGVIFYAFEMMTRKMFVWLVHVEPETNNASNEWIALLNMETGVTLPRTEQQIARAIRFLDDLRAKHQNPAFIYSMASLQNSAAVRIGALWLNTERYFELLENEESNLDEALYSRHATPLQGNWLRKENAVMEFDNVEARHVFDALPSDSPLPTDRRVHIRTTGPFFSVSMLQPLLSEQTQQHIRIPGQALIELPGHYRIQPTMASSLVVNIGDESLPINWDCPSEFEWEQNAPMPLLHASGYFLNIEHRFVEKVDRCREPVLEAISGTKLLYSEKDFGYYVLDLDDVFAQLSPTALHLISSLCANCASPAPFTCNACETYDYCSVDCQRTHWPLHKTLCIGNRKGPVVVTAPHAYCPVPCELARQCDCSAGRWATLLHQELQAAGIESILHLAKTPRAAMDFNRQRARGTAYREQLRSYMDGARLVLDVHSYPGSPERGWEQYDVILLEDRRPTPASSLQFAKATGIALDPNGARNDIQDEAHERGLEAFLLEFNTFGNFRTQQQIIENIVRWVKQ